MTDFIFALMLMQVAGQCRVIYNFAVHRPEYWRGPKWMMIDDDCEDWGWWKPCPKSPAKWIDWFGYGIGGVATLFSWWGFVAGFGLAIASFDIFYHFLYVKPSKRGEQ